ncbi:MAG: sulfotransferase domain-containing protein [Acidimicrobiia bacterium]|nr:sulfotransferase domain-containing protein [Acidimicrobiia bacterium]
MSRLGARVHAYVRWPEFLVIGAQKAGTSTLYAQLVAHPLVLPALTKEVHCFDTARAADERWYRAHFPTVGRRATVEARHGGRVVSGESTPFYLAHPAAPDRAAEMIPDVRLAVVLRDPVQRAISAYHHARHWHLEDRPIEVALDPSAAETPSRAGPEWFDSPECPMRRHGYLMRGRYAEQLERWLEGFGHDRLLVLDVAEIRTGDAARRRSIFWGLRLCRSPGSWIATWGAIRPRTMTYATASHATSRRTTNGSTSSSVGASPGSSRS